MVSARCILSRLVAAALSGGLMLAGLTLDARAQFGEERFLHLQDPNAKRAPPPSWFPFGGQRNLPDDPAQQVKQPPRPVDYSKAPVSKPRDVPPSLNIVVIGDSLADWLGYGLDENFQDMPEVGITRIIDDKAGLTQGDGTTWPRQLSEKLAKDKPDAIVLLFGANERQTLTEGSTKPTQTGEGISEPGSLDSAGWRESYGKRLDALLTTLRAKGVPVYVVGMPALRSKKSMQDTMTFNEILRERAGRQNLSYVDVWDGFVDESGVYQMFGPDVAGQNRRLRTNDGVHFTKAGARKLAHYVERDLRRFILARTAPAALPSADAPEAPKAGIPLQSGPAVRPLAGPVIQLTGRGATPAISTGALLGAGALRALPQDELTRRTLREGQAPPPVTGRADDAVWPRR